MLSTENGSRAAGRQRMKIEARGRRRMKIEARDRWRMKIEASCWIDGG